MHYSEDFVKDVKEILAICAEDLEAISRGEKREATREQIEEYIIPTMNHLLDMASKNEEPQGERGRRGLACVGMITRGWGWNTKSGDKLNHKLPLLGDKYAEL